MSAAQMGILELPGFWLDHPDRDWAFSTQMLLRCALEQLDEAALVLELFEQVVPAAFSPEEQSSGGAGASKAHRLAFLYARSFVYAFDTIVQLTRVIGGTAQLPESARAHCERFQTAFGHCRRIRNSLQHIEDRLRGLGPRGATLATSIIVTGGFINRRFGATVDTGAYAEIEVSGSTIQAAREILEDLVWSFDWLGPGNQRVPKSAEMNGA